jgi:branched-chain amino acid transport system permease protein
MIAYALQQLVNGVTLGMIYGLIAVGYTMVYGIIGMINFAHGDVFMVGAFIGIIVLTALSGIVPVPVGLLVALLLSAALCGLYGFSIERVAYRPLRGSFRLAPLISAIGMSILLENYVQTSQGALERAIPNPIPGGIKLMQQGSFVVQLTWMQIAIIVVTLVTLGVFTYMVTRTPLGRAMRAVEQDAKMAALLGIDTNRTISYTFIIGSALPDVLWRYRFLYRLQCRHQGVHRGGAGRHRLAARRGAGRAADRADRGVLVRLCHARVQGCGGLFHPRDRADVHADRAARP